ncbi:MAG: asparagine synthase (glutamine-hydrolyzing) [Solirubrobacteraceae bacterium]
MCGIVGIVSLDPRVGVEAERVTRMRDVLRHRGPDGYGLWMERSVGLGHRRLAIVDLPGGAQPMANEDESVWLTFNGEIYNHAALREELQSRGHRYRSRSDTETILHLYEEDGERCVERLQGMFAFALWDRRRRRLLLARDRLGIKPLYYAQTERELIFASEIKAILASGAVRPACNTEMLPELLASRYLAGEETLFRNVRKLLPGRTLSWSPGDGVRLRRYWQLRSSAEREPASAQQLAEGVRRRLRTVVDSHLMSDVPLGLFLSGGLDSSALAGVVSRLSPAPIHTFAVGLDEPDANELAHARLVADSLGARHREVTASREDFWRALPGLVWHEDEPIAFPSSVLLHFVSRLARDHVKVVLSGEGADELFLGYNSYRVAAVNQRLGRPYYGAVPAGLRAAVRRSLRRLPGAARRYADRSFLALDPGPRSLICENFAIFPETLQRRLLVDGQTRDPYAHWLQAYDDGEGTTLERMSRADLQTYVVELLMKQDQMSMAASIESRVPFLDHEFVEQVAGIPSGLRLRGLRTKAVLRDAVRDIVPPEIVKRRKMGFPVPIGRWLQGPSWSLVEEYVLSPRARERGLFRPAALEQLAHQHRTGAGRHGDRLWLLLNLELWHRIFIDGEPPSDLPAPVS